MAATFLKEEQIWGDVALGVMKSYGTKTGFSDLAIVLGGLMGRNETSDGQRTGYVWSASSYGFGNVRTVNSNGDSYNNEPSIRNDGARPALPPSVTSKIQPSEARLTRKIGEVQIVEYGEYPKTIASEDINKDLEQAFSNGKLQTTDKKYTFDGEKYDSYDKPFKAKEYSEYQYNGKRYIRVEAQPRDNDSVLSNGNVPEMGKICWIEVQPIEWLQDKSGVWVARQVLFSGVQFDQKKNYDGDFDKTDMKQYLDRYFSKEMQVGRNVDTHAPAIVGSRTETIMMQRQRALEDPTQGL